jgi:hypothetical protein
MLAKKPSLNGFVSGIQVSFADSQTNSLINHVLSANGLSNVIPTSSRKIERWVLSPGFLKLVASKVSVLPLRLNLA